MGADFNWEQVIDSKLFYHETTAEEGLPSVFNPF
jgi:hypothetical protein